MSALHKSTKVPGSKLSLKPTPREAAARAELESRMTAARAWLGRRWLLAEPISTNRRCPDSQGVRLPFWRP